MSGVGGLFILGREAAAWFGSLELPSKLTVATILFATASVGVGLVAPDALPISPFTSSHAATLPAPATSKPAAPVNPSIVASARPTATSRATTSTVALTSTTPTMPGADESKAGTSSSSTPTTEATTKTATSTTMPSALPSSVYYKDCDAAWTAEAAPIRAGQPGYRAELDPDHNGVACEKRP
jgi:hypothetical protein